MIQQRLHDLAGQHGIEILWAIESGSRAWGFPSPDSDYDCRFIYRRPIADYLSLVPMRDVVELTIENDLDINGWDLTKTLRLLVKGNAVVIEWLMSPLLYQGNRTFREDLLQLATRVVKRERLVWHYLQIGRGQRRVHFGDGSSVRLKKLFYVLRPVVALRWLDLHPAQIIPPMHFPTLMRESDVPADIMAVTEELLVRKANTREIGVGQLPRCVAAFIDAELDRPAPDAKSHNGPDTIESLRLSDAVFRRYLKIHEIPPRPD